jgi:hypothetical protein
MRNTISKRSWTVLPCRDHPAALPPGSEAELITGEQQGRATGIA